MLTQPARRRSWYRRLGHTILPLLSALAVTAGLLFGGFNSAAGEAISAIIAVSLLGIALFLTRPALLVWRDLAVPLTLVGLALAWLVLGHVGFPQPRAENYAPDMFLAKFVGLIGGVAILVSGVLIATDRWQVGRVLDLLIVLACFTFLFGLMLRAVGTEGALSYWDVVRRGRFAGTIGNINVTAAAAGAIALISFARLLSYNRPTGQIRWRGQAALAAPLMHGTAFIVAVGTVLATAARFPLVVLTGLLLLLGGLSVLRRTRKRAQIVVVMAIAAVVAALFLGFSGLVMERFAALSAEWHVRALMWTHYSGLASESLLYGYGPGAFSAVNLHNLTDAELAETLWFVNSAHNVLLQVLLVGGVPYLLLFTAAAALIASKIVPHLLGKRRGLEEWGVCAAIAMILSCSLVDIVLDVRATVTLILFLTGLLWGRALPFTHRSGAHAFGSPTQHKRIIGG